MDIEEDEFDELIIALYELGRIDEDNDEYELEIDVML